MQPLGIASDLGGFWADLQGSLACASFMAGRVQGPQQVSQVHTVHMLSVTRDSVPEAVFGYQQVAVPGCILDCGGWLMLAMPRWRTFLVEFISVSPLYSGAQVA